MGYVDVAVDANGNVVCMRDDYDFAYGFEMDRSDGSRPGDPFSGRKPGSKTLNKNYDQVKAKHGDPGRALPVNAFFGCDGGGHNGGGRGAPVPIRVCF